VRAGNGVIEAYVGVEGVGKGVKYEGPSHRVCADAVTRLPTPPTPKAPDARGEDARYVPKRGDVIRFSGGASGEAGALRVLLSPDPTSKWGAWKARALIGMRPTGDPIPTMAQHWTFVRAATTEDLLTILDVSKEV
jgi:hypothetical protein